MRIGPLGFRFTTVLHLAACLVLLAVVARLYRAGQPARLAGPLVEPIRTALLRESPEAAEQGALCCRQLLAVQPECVAARLWLGTLLCRAGKYEPAREAFEAAASAPRATADEKASALVGAAAATLLGSDARERAQALPKAQAYCRRAAEAQPDQGDVLVATACLALWRPGPEGADECLASLEAAARATPPPGLTATADMFRLWHAALIRKKRTQEAQEARHMVAVIQPSVEAQSNGHEAEVLAPLMTKGMARPDREKLLEKYEAELGAFGAERAFALNALAAGWWYARDRTRPAQFMEKIYPRAVALLNQALAGFPGDARAYWNLTVYLEERLYGPYGEGGLTAALPPGSLTARPPQPAENPWSQTPPGPALAPAVPAALETAGTLARTLRDLRARVPLDVAEKTEAAFHLFQADYVAWCLAKDASAREPLLREMEALSPELTSVPQPSPAALRACGALLMRRGQYQAALPLLEKARSRSQGAALTALNELLGILKQRPNLYDVQPQNGVSFGKLPLVRATCTDFRTPGALEGTLTFDDKPAPAQLVGTQLLWAPATEQLTEGVHTLVFSFRDGLGNASREELKLYTDRTPPVVSVDPAPPDGGGKLKLPRPVWNISLRDEKDGSGVDLDSVTVELRWVGPAGPRRDVLIRHGSYAGEMPNIDMRAGARLSTETFRVASVADLAPGLSYTLALTFADRAGNVATFSQAYRPR